MVHLTGTYSDVDRSADPVGAAEWMDTMCDWPFIRAYKERTVDLLHVKPGARLLDVGCGTGHDTRALATAAGPEGVAIGIDASAVMLKAARTRGGSYLQADARILPYDGGAFDGTRIDRVLQHVAGPGEAVGELVRVTRSGGRMVAIDPDQ
jgi:ubiquinone/menaquinone biosynthesis C-methylase UbiE